MSYGGYRRWKPNNRRNRRARASSSSSRSQSTDRSFLVIMGLFLLTILLLLGALALFTG